MLNMKKTEWQYNDLQRCSKANKNGNQRFRQEVEDYSKQKKKFNYSGIANLYDGKPDNKIRE